MYAGIAAGKRSAHSIKSLRKNLYLVINQAQEIPIKSEKPPTPIIKRKVLEKYKNNFVLKRCAQVSKLFWREDKIKTRIGVKIIVIKKHDKIFQKFILFVTVEKNEFAFMI